MMEQLINQISEQARTDSPDDYLGEDGLIYCGKCHTRKQLRLKKPCTEDQEMIVHVLCTCERENREAEDAERLRQEKIAEIWRMKSSGIHDRALLESCFENDDGSTPQIALAKEYVESWQERKASNDGLLLWGNVGTGKTYFAACIANALIEQGVPVLMTNFSKILNQLSGLYADEKNEFISSMMRYQLLVIDDFGIERNTEYALEQVYNVIDERYKTNLPLIVTTNLTMEDLKNPETIAYACIYDRVLSMCIPIQIEGENHRLKDRSRKLENGRNLLKKTEEKKLWNRE